MQRIIPILILALLAISCQNSKNNLSNDELDTLQIQLDSLQQIFNEQVNSLPKGQIKTFLTFQDNNAEEAMNFYIELFENSKVTSVQKHGKEGTIMFATFELNGSLFACSDSYIKHEWDFTPGVSIFVECKTDEEIEKLATKLAENGKVLMPIANYGFSTKFTFIEDQFGVSWQLNLN
ncbi:VOC family protein [uncultured Kordia sp.]|uniref:VOC family protein n=1 Tax=uncultured Kordia sp. TaxID=507699 RepID=UPI0026081884|nr:VOC family protein [uncultured Kordia sp.]